MIAMSTTVVASMIGVKVNASIKDTHARRRKNNLLSTKGFREFSTTHRSEMSLFMMILVTFITVFRMVNQEMVGLGTNWRERFIFHITSNL